MVVSSRIQSIHTEGTNTKGTISLVYDHVIHVLVPDPIRTAGCSLPIDGVGQNVFFYFWLFLNSNIVYLQLIFLFWYIYLYFFWFSTRVISS